MKKFAQYLCLAGILFGFLFVGSCASQEDEEDATVVQEELSVQLTMDNEQNVVAEFSNGQAAYGWVEYEEMVQSLYAEGQFLTNVAIQYESSPEQTSVGDGFETQLNPLTVKVPFTSYYITITSPHKNYVGGCIGKTVTHVNFIINQKGGTLYLDLHLAVWMSNGKPCVGVYITPSKWCSKICGPSMDQIRKAIKSALVAAGISAAAAAVIAEVLAPIGVAALAL